MFVRSMLWLCAFCMASAASAATVSGNVYRDFDGDGLFDNTGASAELGLAGVQINAIDELGNTTSTTSTAVGAWSTTLAGNQQRIEFTTTLRIEPGSAPLTTVVFRTGAATNVHVAFSSPPQFCQDTPSIAASVYSNGNPNSTGSAGTNSWMVRAPLFFTPDVNPAVATIANGQVIGSTFGTVYHRSTDSLFAAAFTKRHSGFGIGDGVPAVAVGTNTNETGAIYRIASPNAATPVASLWLDLQAQGIATGAVPRIELATTAGIDPPPTDAQTPNIDGLAFDAVGKTGLGAMVLLPNETALFVINLFDRQLYEVPITRVAGVPVANAAGIVQHDLAAVAPVCTNGVFRPFALGQRDGFIYVGGVCSGESAGGTAANLSAAVFRHDPAGANGNFTSVFTIASLAYPRGAISVEGGNQPSAAWGPWIDAWGDIAAPLPGAGPFAQTLEPQPMLSTLAFDADGSMVLGFIDRFSHQAGNANFSTLDNDGGPRAVYEGVAGGDTLLACYDSALDSFTLESAAACGSRVSDATASGQGPGNGEYFWHDKFDGYPVNAAVNGGGHRETTLGGVAVHFPRRELVASVFDPRNAFRAAGWRVFNLVDTDAGAGNTAGENARSVEVFGQDAGGALPVRFGKAAGIGNVELLCLPKPVQIGNRLWIDLDRDGVQDPAEAPVANVAMTLFDAAGNVRGQTSTNAQGEWFFDLTRSATLDPNTADSNVLLLDPYFASYFVTIDPAEFLAGGDLFGRRATTADADVSVGGDLRDSDVVTVAVPTVGNRSGVAVAVLGPGANNHTIDGGFVAVDLGDLPDTSAGTGVGNYQTLLANGGPSHTIIPTLRLGACVDGEIDGQPVATANGDDGNVGGDLQGVCAIAGDDEDSVAQIALDALVAGQVASIAVAVTNTGAITAGVCGFIDFNADGDFGEPGEAAFVAANATGSVNLAFTPPANSVRTTFARFRYSSDYTALGTCAENGAAANGEVEDYTATVARFDFGDLPDAGAGTGTSDYSTLLANNGPRHTILAAGNPALGVCVDSEADGLPTVPATGDDTDSSGSAQGVCAGDDEDGVAFPPMVAGTIVNVPVTSGTTGGTVTCFVDFNDDGDFVDGGELAIGPAAIAANVTVPFAVAVPAAADGGADGFSYARCRIGSAAIVSPDGASANGEVEDYRVALLRPSDFGDAPASFGTNGAGAASHVILGANNPRFGACIDAEGDGQPNVGANGDDVAIGGALQGVCAVPGDDEDGVTIPTLTAGQNATLSLTAGPTGGNATCFIDYNDDGDFGDAGEQALPNTPIGANATINPVVAVPPGTTGGADASVYARCRISAAGGDGPTAAAASGEVEDYIAGVIRLDFGDLPDSGPGTGADNYETLLPNGPRHTIVAGLFMGAGVDAEGNGQPSAPGSATADDSSGAPDDEDGVDTADLVLVEGVAPQVDVTVTNTTGAPAVLCGFIDFDGNGSFVDAGEQSITPVASGAVAANVVLNGFGAVPIGAASNGYARFRFSTLVGCSANGPAPDGEVEDYTTATSARDFGDAPDSYGTSGAGAASHVILATDNPLLGVQVDAETDGQPSVGADGDDVGGSDDEDGVTWPTLVPGTSVNVSITAGATGGTTTCFVDFNDDGDFADAGEQAVPDTAIAAGATLTPSINVPAAATGGADGQSYARCRIAIAGGLSSTDAAPSGEVEDYRVDIAAPADFGDAPVSYGTSGVGAATHTLLLANNPTLGACVDAESDGQPAVGADGDDLGIGAPVLGVCNGNDDEDGVSLPPLTAGQSATLTISSGTTGGLLACFIDFNIDGDFADAGEQVLTDTPIGANSTLTPSIAVPATAVDGSSYARCRISSVAGAGPTGAIADGEVEDYVVTLGTAFDFGDLPSPVYPTLLPAGARHQIVDGLRIGATVDAEADGQPTLAADGDDAIGDDEDGVTFSGFAVGQSAQATVVVTNTVGAGSQVCGFADFNDDGDFADASETASAIAPDGTLGGSIPLVFGVVPNGAAAQTYVRVRLSTDAGCVADGEAADGEVEDYRIDVADPVDFGDAPLSYGTSGVGAASHPLLPANNPLLGACVDAESDGQPNAAADGDDVAPGTSIIGTCVGNDDEDGVVLPPLTAGQSETLSISSGATGGVVNCYIDYNIDGDFADAGEQVLTDAPIAANTTLAPAISVPAVIGDGASYARCRISSAAGVGPTGAAIDGEVEDYVVTLGTAFDFGDLPSPAYPTLLPAGARHQIVDGLRIGAVVDAEADGQPNVTADGDDLAGDDEDGVSFTGFQINQSAQADVVVTNTRGVVAQVCGYADFNNDGDFGDVSETATATAADGTLGGSVSLLFGVVPASAPAQVYLRVRLSTDAVCSASGAASDGEIEDYVVPVTSGVLELGNLVWEDRDDDGVVDPGEPGIPGVTVELFEDADGNCIADGVAIASEPTNATGNYLFDGLLPGTYIVSVIAPPGYFGATGNGSDLGTSGPYEPGPDPDSDIDNDDNGTGLSGTIRTCGVTLQSGSEPINDGDVDPDTNLTVDLGLVPNFDLALRKQIAVGQPTVVALGEDVDFTITVYNQGSLAATGILLMDTIPVGMVLNDADWTSVAGNSATLTLPGPLSPGASTSIDITLRVTSLQAQYRNTAEIVSGNGPDGNPRVDVDSEPDADPNNDGPLTDDSVDNTDGDEDDADPAIVTSGAPPGVVPVLVPASSPLNLLILVLASLLLGFVALRRRD